MPESAMRVQFQADATTVDLRLENSSRKSVSAHASIQILDPAGVVRVQALQSINVSAGVTKTEIVLPAISASEKDQAKGHLFLYRLHYFVAANSSDGSALPAVEGIVSIGEIAPQLFELHAATAKFVKAGNHYALHVRAIQPATSAPVQGVAVQGSLDLNEDKPILTGKAVTDGHGYATLEFSLPASLDLDDSDIDVTVSGSRDGFTATANSTISVPEEISATLSTDKPLYQPGQTLHVRLLAFDSEKKAFADQPLTVDIKDPEGTLVFRSAQTTSRYGIASADWQIPENLRLGEYKIEAEFDDTSLDATYEANVKISRYELPTFSVAVKPDHTYYLPGQNASVEVRANYLYGEPVRRGHVRVVRETDREWDFREQKWKVEEAEVYEGEADAQGKFVAQVDLTKAHDDIDGSTWRRFENTTYTAYFTDAVTNRVEERRFDLRVTLEPIHVYLIQSGLLDYPHEFYISTDYADGTPVACEVQIKWIANAPSGGASSSPAGEEKLLTKVRTNSYGVAKVTGLKTPDIKEPGDFTLIVEAKDDKGLTGSQRENIWRRETVRGVQVSTDKIIYQQGEAIDVNLKSTLPDTPLIVEAVRDEKVIATQIVRLRGGHASTVFLPNDKFQNRVTIVAYAVGVHAESEPGEAEFVSFRNVLFPKNNELNFDVRLAKSTYLPGENVPADLRISGPEGQQLRAAVGVVVVDRAVEERERTDRDLRGNSGFYGYRGLRADDELQGVRIADLEKLDLSKPLPDGLELVAEILMHSDFEEQPKFFDIDSPSGSVSELFSREIDPQMNLIRAALTRYYAHNYPAENSSAYKGAYPKSKESLKGILSSEEIDFSALRDPWNMPYYAKFGVERNLETLEIWTTGPDKKVGTHDDYQVLKMEWEYFKPHRDAISQAVHEFHERTGGYIRDAATLNDELAAHGFQFDSWKDPWGHAYKASFSAMQNNYVVTVTSAGPDGIFTPEGQYPSDDFEVATVQINYFEETRLKIDHALFDNFNKTFEYPDNTDQLRSVLQKYDIDWDSLKDPWGHAYVALFSQMATYADDVTIQTIPDGFGINRTHTTPVPVTRMVERIHIRSEGAGSKEQYARDFEAASFSHTIVKQSSGDRAPVSLSNQTVLAAGKGAIAGTVYDPEGKAIAGAQVTVKNSVTDEVFMGVSDDSGVYLFRNISPGRYVLSVSATNFKSSITTNIGVFSANTTTVDVKLEVGTVMMAVEVEVGQQAIETQNTSVMSVKEVPGTPKSGQAAAAPLISTPRLRQYFPETLFWQPEIITDAAGRAHLSIPLADNITTWKLSAVASTEKGEIASAEKDIRAFQRFFVEHDPPKFLTEGDEIDLPVVLRNYLNHGLHMNVVMKPESWFIPLGPVSAKTDVAASDSATDIFKFRAAGSVKNGKQRITATGVGAGPGDAIERTVTVRPNGEEKTETKSFVFDDTAALDLQIPTQAIAGSLEAELKIYPNLNAHILESIEAVLERPYGCAEQTISSTYPSILLLKYMKSAGMESSPLAPKARRYVQQGYERLLSYRARGGGFSYWGRGDSDLALTAYALRFLQDASEFIEIDDSIVGEQVRWILHKAETDGRWIGRDWRHEEDSRQTLIVTAYIARVIANLDFRGSLSTADAGLEKEISDTLKHSLEYLEAKVAETDEPYLVASYALALPKLPNGAVDSRLAASLERLRKLERHEADASYWALEMNTPFFGWGLAGRIETTALVLQALKKGGGNSEVDRELLSRGVLFLLKNQDRYGIWYSSQATINVLDALRVLTLGNGATLYSAQSGKAEIFVDGRVVQTVELRSSNELVAPVTVDISKFISPGNHHVEIRRGTGATPASVQAISTYYIPWANTSASGEAYEHAEKVSDALRLAVHFDKPTAKVGEKIECSVNAERIGFRGYGMMLAEIGLPPGAEVDRDSLDRAMRDSGWEINQYDVLPDRLIVYLWPHAGGTKFTFTFTERYGLMAQTPASILYDYYNPEALATVLPTLFKVQK
nr:MG2 domain-containing protein [Candidatus Acidoferrales bacterium]